LLTRKLEYDELTRLSAPELDAMTDLDGHCRLTPSDLNRLYHAD